MPSTTITTTVTVIGGGVVGTAILHTLAHRGVAAVLLEAESELALQASGTNSGVLHTGFDSTPGQLETDLIVRSAKLRPAIFEALGVPVLRCGAVLAPHRTKDAETIEGLVRNATSNGVEVHLRDSDGALLVPGESVTDPVAYVLALASSAKAAGARIELAARVVAIDEGVDHLTIRLADGREVTTQLLINAAGLRADEVARLLGDSSFDIYPRKGEFFVFELPDGARLQNIILPVPTKRTKGVLVFPTLDGHVVAGPTAVDLDDKSDWSVRPTAHDEILGKAIEQFPALANLSPVAAYAGLRPAGRDSNYVVAPSSANARMINVAAIRSTGLSASLGIAEYVTALLPQLGIELGEQLPISPAAPYQPTGPWWRRTARHFAAVG